MSVLPVVINETMRFDVFTGRTEVSNVLSANSITYHQPIADLQNGPTDGGVVSKPLSGKLLPLASPELKLVQ